MKFLSALILGTLVATSPSSGGSYVDVADCNSTLGCQESLPANPAAQCPACPVTPFAVVHPLGYDGTQNALNLRICLDSDAMELLPGLEWSIKIWNEAVAVPRNCHGCHPWEDTPFPSGPKFAATVLLHELGHCAVGLGHPNRPWDVGWDGVFEETSFTRSLGVVAAANGISPGVDGIRGTADDLHIDAMGEEALSVSWFRTSDNDPFVLDSTLIDRDTYSSARSSHPSGDRRGANANRFVGLHLGYAKAQSVMYSGATAGQFFSGLSADDVNMIKMARTGADRLAGTADDYTLTLQYVGECGTNAHDLRVRYGMSPNLGLCQNQEIGYSYPQNPLLAWNYSVQFDPNLNPAGPLVVSLSSLADWDYAVPVFFDGFESGDTSGWDAP